MHTGEKGGGGGLDRAAVEGALLALIYQAARIVRCRKVVLAVVNVPATLITHMLQLVGAV